MKIDSQFYFAITNILIANHVRAFIEQNKDKFRSKNFDDHYWEIREKYLGLWKFSKKSAQVFKWDGFFNRRALILKATVTMKV